MVPPPHPDSSHRLKPPQLPSASFHGQSSQEQRGRATDGGGTAPISCRPPIPPRICCLPVLSVACVDPRVEAEEKPRRRCRIWQKSAACRWDEVVVVTGGSSLGDCWDWAEARLPDYRNPRAGRADLGVLASSCCCDDRSSGATCAREFSIAALDRCKESFVVIAAQQRQLQSSWRSVSEVITGICIYHQHESIIHVSQMPDDQTPMPRTSVSVRPLPNHRPIPGQGQAIYPVGRREDSLYTVTAMSVKLR